MSNIERRVAIVGAAHPHVLGLAQAAGGIDGMRIVGVYDDDPRRAREVAGALDVPVATQLGALLEERPDAAMIVAVPNERADLAIQCVHAGIPVLVDKPLALDWDALERLKHAARESGKRALTYYPTRGQPLVAAAHQAVRAGRIGRVVRVMASAPHWLRPETRPAWHFERSTNGDIFIDLACHSFDICCWLLDQSPSDITARFGNFANADHPDFRDLGQCSLRFPNGELADVEVDWFIAAAHAHYSDMRLWIQGTFGRIDVHLGRTEHATICTRDASEPLQPAPMDLEQWTRELLIALCDDAPAALSQEDVWRASEVSLRASDAARAEERDPSA